MSFMNVPMEEADITSKAAGEIRCERTILKRTDLLSRLFSAKALLFLSAYPILSFFNFLIVAPKFSAKSVKTESVLPEIKALNFVR